MNPELSPERILLLAQLLLIFILYQTSKPARQLIFAQGRKTVLWIVKHVRHRLPALPMSPLKPRHAATKEIQN